MYSILIKTTSGDKFSYYLNSDGEVYVANTLEELGAKIGDLLNSYTLERVVPIKNCIVTKNIVVEEAGN